MKGKFFRRFGTKYTRPKRNQKKGSSGGQFPFLTKIRVRFDFFLYNFIYIFEKYNGPGVLNSIESCTQRWKGQVLFSILKYTHVV
jgi:hypothetical protein